MSPPRLAPLFAAFVQLLNVLLVLVLLSIPRHDDQKRATVRGVGVGGAGALSGLAALSLPLPSLQRKRPKLYDYRSVRSAAHAFSFRCLLRRSVLLPPSRGPPAPLPVVPRGRPWSPVVLTYARIPAASLSLSPSLSIRSPSSPSCLPDPSMPFPPFLTQSFPLRPALLRVLMSSESSVRPMHAVNRSIDSLAWRRGHAQFHVRFSLNTLDDCGGHAGSICFRPSNSFTFSC